MTSTIYAQFAGDRQRELLTAARDYRRARQARSRRADRRHGQCGG
ncbi:MAG: hypothetical protein ACRDT2_12795 [Natronosporangium sp.]